MGHKFLNMWLVRDLLWLGFGVRFGLVYTIYIWLTFWGFSTNLTLMLGFVSEGGCGSGCGWVLVLTIVAIFRSPTSLLCSILSELELKLNFNMASLTTVTTDKIIAFRPNGRLTFIFCVTLSKSKRN